MSDDEELIRCVLQGDVERFRPLVERYQRPILRFILNMIGHRELAEDLAQEVFLAAYRGLRSFDADRSKFSTWLFTIARNKTLTALRRREKTHHGQPIDPPNPCTGMDESERNELEHALDRALAELPAEQKTAFILAEFDDLSYDEIARIERTRIGSVRSRISRVRAKLREALRDYKERP